LGETFAVISGQVVTHSASTSKVDLIGEWEDPIDDPKLPAPTTRAQLAHLCEVPIEEGVSVTAIRDGAKPDNPKHNFGDTKFHTVTYQPIGTTRFREFFPTSITDNPANLKLEGPPSNSVLVKNSALSVVGYPVHFDNDRKLWFGDILMDVGQSYAAFIRLALVRFQPNSVPNAELSPVVRAEFAQLAPHRSASVTTAPTGTGATIHIGVKGLTFEASSATLAAARLQSPFGKVSGHTGHAAIEALLQKRDPSLGTDPHLGWETISTTPLKHDVVANLGAWEGLVTLNQTLVPDTFRILLQEYEWYRSDSEVENAEREYYFRTSNSLRRRNSVRVRRVRYCAVLAPGLTTRMVPSENFTIWVPSAAWKNRGAEFVEP